MITDEELAAIVNMQKLATQGRWKWSDRKVSSSDSDLAGLFAGNTEICNFGNDTEYYPIQGEEPSTADKEYIAAACSPEGGYVSILLAALRESREEVERLQEVLEFYANGATPYYLQFDLGLKARQALATSSVIRENHVAAGSVIP